MAHSNEQADKLISFATPEEQHALLHNNAGSLHQIWKIPYQHVKEIINCFTCRPLHFRPITQSINPRGLQPNELWQMDVTHCPELSPSYISQSVKILPLYGPHLPEVKLHNMLLTTY